MVCIIKESFIFGLEIFAKWVINTFLVAICGNEQSFCQTFTISPGDSNLLRTPISELNAHITYLRLFASASSCSFYQQQAQIHDQHCV